MLFYFLRFKMNIRFFKCGYNKIISFSNKYLRNQYSSKNNIKRILIQTAKRIENELNSEWYSIQKIIRTNYDHNTQYGCKNIY